jgi:hypothetical protein
MLLWNDPLKYNLLKNNIDYYYLIFIIIYININKDYTKFCIPFMKD